MTYCSLFSIYWIAEKSIIFSLYLTLKMITLLKLSIFLISASLTIASKKRCLRNVKKLKKQNEELQNIIQELETDGEWGSWSGWSDCRSSSFCGRGFTTRSRSCTPAGKYCEGDTVEVKECDNGQCPTTGLNKSNQILHDPM